MEAPKEVCRWLTHFDKSTELYRNTGDMGKGQVGTSAFNNTKTVF